MLCQSCIAKRHKAEVEVRIPSADFGFVLSGTVIVGLTETPPLDTTQKKCYNNSVEREMGCLTDWVSFSLKRVILGFGKEHCRKCSITEKLNMFDSQQVATHT